MNFEWRTKPGFRSHAFWRVNDYEFSFAECGVGPRVPGVRWPVARDELNRCAHCVRAVEKRTKRRKAA